MVLELSANKAHGSSNFVVVRRIILGRTHTEPPCISSSFSIHEPCLSHNVPGVAMYWEQKGLAA